MVPTVTSAERLLRPPANPLASLHSKQLSPPSPQPKGFCDSLLVPLRRDKDLAPSLPQPKGFCDLRVVASTSVRDFRSPHHPPAERLLRLSDVVEEVFGELPSPPSTNPKGFCDRGAPVCWLSGARTHLWVSQALGG